MFRIMKATFVLCAVAGVSLRGVCQSPTKAIRISDSVYMAPGAGNVYMVITPGGNVIIDTSSRAGAPNARKLLTAQSNGPVRFIILTHGHADHISGIALWKEPGTTIIAQRNYVEFVNYTTRLAGFFAPRNAAGFGRPPEEVGPWAGNYGATIDPTVLFDQKYEFELGGTRFQLFSTSGETPDHLTVWIPSARIAFIGDNYAGAAISEPMSFPNIYTLRGTRPRPALDWISSIDKVLALKPDIVLSGHGDPIIGNQEITRRLTRLRDAIQYIHDETVKGMNSGKDVFTLMQEIKLPARFDLSESFGKVSWSVRGIYDGYAGWFDENPATMYSVPPSAVYPDLVKLAGGSKPIVQLALDKLKQEKPVETLHLIDIVLASEPKDPDALAARLKALNYLAEKCQNYIGEGWLQFAITKTKAQLALPR